MKDRVNQSKYKLLLLFLLVLILIFSPGCSNTERINTNGTYTQVHAESAKKSSGPKAVSILVDLIDGGGPPDAITKTLNEVPGYGKDFIYKIETIPQIGEDRDSAITRVRTEILAGKGPDLFLCSQKIYGVNAGPEEMPLFKFPVQSMSNHIFLPLDGYIDEAQYIDWNSLQPVVMDAGRNEEGQQIIPLAYTFQVTLFDNSYTPNTHFPITWEQMTEDSDPNIRVSANGLTYNIIGNLADYSKDVPSFSEEELLGWVTKKYDTWQTIPEDSRNAPCVIIDQRFLADPSINISLSGKQEYTMIPVFNISGGVTADITTFAAINRNAQHPDEAFQIIDFLLNPEVQQTSTLFQYRMEGLPVYTGTGSSDAPLNSYWQMNEVNYEAVSAIQEQINVANFPGPLEACIWDVAWFNKEIREKSAHEQYVLMQMLLAES